MARATIPSRRKHLYFYTLLVLGTIFLATLKPIHIHNPKAPQNSRAAAVNNLANTLFQ